MVNLKVFFFKNRSKVMVKVKCLKFMLPLERSCHKEHMPYIKPELLLQKSYMQYLSLLTDRQQIE